MSVSNYDPSLALFYLRRIFSQDRDGESLLVSSIKYTIKHNLPYGINMDLEFVATLPKYFESLLQWQYDALDSYDVDVVRYFEDDDYRASLSRERDPCFVEHCFRVSKFAIQAIKRKKENEYKENIEGTNYINQKDYV